MATYYDEVRDVLDEEGGSDEVVDVDAGFLVEAPVVVLPEVLAPAVGEQAAASWESTKGLCQIRNEPSANSCSQSYHKAQ